VGFEKYYWSFVSGKKLWNSVLGLNYAETFFFFFFGLKLLVASFLLNVNFDVYLFYYVGI
jgi:hypothetical protein